MPDVEATAPTPTAPPADTPARPAAGLLTLAGVASLGAGAIHAAAVGVHSEHRSAVIAFSVVAAAQLAWGVAAVARPHRLLVALGVAVQGAALGGWLLAKTTGIGFVAGLDESEAIQMADGVAAALAAAALLLALAGLVRAGAPAPSTAPRLALGRGALVVGVAGLSLAAMISAGSHSHPGGGHGHGEEVAAGDHAHGDAAAAGADHDPADGHHDGEEAGDGAAHDDHAAPTPRPYDPELPIDLSGMPGVTPQQQAAAENLIAITLIRLPKYADVAVAEADGFRSIGDGLTGHEHYINWDYIDDEHVLNPDYPESLVYDTTGDEKRLVSAMFMTKRGVSLDDVPEVGGPLTQWHVHDDLCFTAGDSPRVRGITTVGGECQPPLQKFDPTPMIHVWITPHRCGPFAALEGVGAGQIKEGEERLCDHAHGAGHG